MQNFFRSRLSELDEPTRSLRSQNVGKKIFLQESTRRTRRVDSWPETEIVTELCQKLNLLRSRLLVKDESTLGLRPDFSQKDSRKIFSSGVDSQKLRVDSASG